MLYADHVNPTCRVLAVALIAACDSQPAAEQDAGAVECPPEMVLVPHPVSPFCMDAHEATIAAFRALQPWARPEGGVPAFCESKSWDDLSLPPVDAGQELHAMGYVDACDAFAFCARSGKRLCGRIGGGAVPMDFEALHDADVSEWFYACTAGGTQRFPHGDEYDAEACHVENSAAPRVVGSAADCEGGFAGIFDASGNVWEWEDACITVEREGEVSGACEVRGGGTQAGFGYSERFSACTATGTILFDTWLPSHFKLENVGVRCCADPRGSSERLRQLP